MMTTEVVPEWKSASEVIAAIQAKAAQAAKTGAAWLLVHADFAVGLGRADGQGVVTLPEADELLHPDYLQEFRLFGSEGEWHVWRYRDKFYARFRADAGDAPETYIEEHHALWGTRSQAATLPGWTTVSEERGARFAVPHAVILNREKDALRLRVRHYLATEADTGLTTICDSRLVALCDADKKDLF